MVYEKFNSIPGIRCNRLQGSMYAFPQVEIPEGALRDAHVSVMSKLVLVVALMCIVSVYV